MYRIIHDRPNCIGCGACAAVCPKFWEMNDDGKSDLRGSRDEGEMQVLDVEEIGCNMDAAEVCPVNVIHIEKDGKRLI